MLHSFLSERKAKHFRILPDAIVEAFDIMLQQKGVTELGDKEYNFINFLVKDGLNANLSDIYKTSFNFSGLVIQDICKVERCSCCFNILDAFLRCGPIQKIIFDEWYDNLNKVFLKVFNDNSKEIKFCKDIIEDLKDSTKVQEIKEWYDNHIKKHPNHNILCTLLKDNYNKNINDYNNREFENILAYPSAVCTIYEKNVTTSAV